MTISDIGYDLSLTTGRSNLPGKTNRPTVPSKSLDGGGVSTVGGVSWGRGGWSHGSVGAVGWSSGGGACVGATSNGNGDNDSSESLDHLDRILLLGKQISSVLTM